MPEIRISNNRIFDMDDFTKICTILLLIFDFWIFAIFLGLSQFAMDWRISGHELWMLLSNRSVPNALLLCTAAHEPSTELALEWANSATSWWIRMHRTHSRLFEQKIFSLADFLTFQSTVQYWIWKSSVMSQRNRNSCKIRKTKKLTHSGFWEIWNLNILRKESKNGA